MSAAKTIIARLVPILVEILGVKADRIIPDAGIDIDDLDPERQLAAADVVALIDRHAPAGEEEAS